ncbi:hypothetical protein DFA_01621 [Cavenderia fasciculata]|uniref:Uncharacterized protein n=1 Tax=Cavenderia fasciculata TaxID=261658 RepID=F4PTR5_CACFS|nr:uncharacterized protein DFA_01621 [Cavenderia fasciculata]EGG21735.1 hypothetical protein DFA_01621 [Cavenderia fasciculata]|eukprot:XP_004359585.1 hypothetical protein DFA_01621 [Cavenderia fasciculata]
MMWMESIAVFTEADFDKCGIVIAPAKKLYLAAQQLKQQSLSHQHGSNDKFYTEVKDILIESQWNGTWRPFEIFQVALETFYANVFTRFMMHQDSYDKMDHPFLVVPGAPGIGKTRYLYECHKVFEQEYQDKLDEKQRLPSNFPTCMLHLVVSYGNGTSFQEKSELNEQETLSLRLFHRYFFDGIKEVDGASFTNFCQAIKSRFQSPLGLGTCLSTIYQHLIVQKRIEDGDKDLCSGLELVRDSLGGWPRLLEIFWFDYFSSDVQQRANKVVPFSSGISEFHGRLSGTSYHRSLSSPPPFIQTILSYAITCKSVESSSLIPDSNTTFEQAEMDSCIRIVKFRGRHVVDIPYFFVKMYAQRVASPSSASLTQLFYYLESSHSKIHFGDWEIICAIHQDVRTQMFAQDKTVRVGDFLPGIATDFTSEQILDLTNLNGTYLLFQGKHIIGETRLTGAMFEKELKSLDEAQLKPYLYIFVTNRGVDLPAMITSRTQDNIIILNLYEYLPNFMHPILNVQTPKQTKDQAIILQEFQSSGLVQTTS